MKLYKKQARFTDCLVELIRKLTQEYGYEVVIGEVERPQVTADYYAKQGIGSKNSCHIYKLAADLALFKNGEYLRNTSEYATAGGIWKSLDPEARWGGDFGDGNHFSFEHNGVK